MTNFKTHLRERQVVIGTPATMASGNSAEPLSRVGFDYIWIDSEHGPATGGGPVSRTRVLQEEPSSVAKCRPCGSV